jgi:hypothetical protein
VIVRDPANNVLNENDLVSYPLAFGQCVLGTVVKIDPGLSNLNAQQPQPGFVVVQLLMPLVIDPSGHVGGVFKVAQPQETQV